MDIKWLKTFVVAAEKENFRLASEKLYMAQATVTVHIKNLESHLGMKLFEKKGRNILLTAAGKRYLIHARRMIEAYERGIEDLESWRQGYHRKLRIAVSPLIAASVLPHLVRGFTNRHKEIEITILVRESLEISQIIRNGEADIGLSLLIPVHPDVQARKLYDDPICLVVPHDGRDAESAPPIDFEEVIHNHVILTHNHPEYWDELLNALRARYPRIRTMAVSQVHITKRFIEEGFGVSFLPRSAVKREIIEGRVLEVFPHNFPLPIAATYLVTMTESEETNLFVNYLGEFYP